MGTGFRSRHAPARRRSRRLKVAIEPVAQFRATDEPIHRREGTLVPATHLLGRMSDPVSTISNPAYLQITPAFNDDGTPIDVKPGDLFIRLKYLDGEQTTDEKITDHATCTRVRHSLEVHSYEIRYQMLRILGDLF